VHERAELEFNKNGELLGGFGTVQEITEIKEMQEKLEEHAKHLADLVEERTKKLKDAERLATIGETAGMVGHDIRNPLQSIIGEVYLAKDELKPLPDCEAKNSLKETMTIIEEQIEYINKIVTDLQDFAKPLIPCMEEADLENIIKTVSSTMEIPENVEFTYLLEQGFPKFKADTAYLKRTLINLFSNAVQAMPNGGKLTLQALRENCSVVITVEDTGVGIPEEFKSKMFQPLCTTKSKGQGFGLAVCKRLVEAMGGTVTFDSQEGKGTKFIIRLPLLTL
jgi:signal transduction histidine kinase